ncbi:MAG: ABC transporter permease [Candidatus Bathyarchaeia archaeon]|nr:ABC transporter permease [Candidatus Bathyarchaeota archaeon A05DMB-4]MDH7595529.1 ABC transporter permease [Candidatus Bathyarchaeota archaeon]
MNWFKRYKNSLIQLSAAVVFLILWQLGATVLNLVYFPSLSDTVMAFYQLVVYGDAQGNSLLTHSFISLYRVFAGFSIALVLALALGLLCGVNEAFYSMLKPLIEVIRPIPPLAWVPFASIAFGIAIGGYAFVIFLGAFFPIFLNTVTGVKRTSSILVDVAKTFKADKKDVMFKVIVPSALPEITTGMRIGFGIAWMCIIAAEMIGVKSALGLGFFIFSMANLALYAEMFAGMIMIGLISYVINEGFMLAERQFFKWRVEIAK